MLTYDSSDIDLAIMPSIDGILTQSHRDRSV